MGYLLAPNELIIAEDARNSYTTYERLAKHLIVEHGEMDWVVSNRAQVELESMHNSHHHKDRVNKSNHTHEKPVIIVGYEPKPKPKPKYLTWAEYNR